MCSSFKCTEPLFVLVIVLTDRHTDRHTDGHEYSIVAVDKTTTIRMRSQHEPKSDVV